MSRSRKPQNTRIRETEQFQLSSNKRAVVEGPKRKKWSVLDMVDIKPMTDNQRYAYEEWSQDQHLVLGGFAGCGKSFIAMHMALQAVLSPDTMQDKIIIIRSATPTREIGFLPGTEEEKNSVYEAPYRQICDQLFRWSNSYDNLKESGFIEFHNTSFLRGLTFDNAVVIFDEFQSNTEHEATTVASRMGVDSRLLVCGDDFQNDIGSKSGSKDFIPILRRMASVSFVDFKLNDIVRSGFCREFLIAKYS